MYCDPGFDENMDDLGSLFGWTRHTMEFDLFQVCLISVVTVTSIFGSG